MSTSDEDTSVCTPPEIRKEASNVQCNQLLPQKSKEFYLKVYAQFKDWCKIKKVAKVSENVLLVYMEEKAKNKKASSLWATFSMLKQTLKLKENVDISKYYKVIAFLKRKNDSYTPKKAAVFEKHQITKFILEAPDEIFLSSKVILIIEIAGACRTDELCNMKMTDVDTREDMIVINIPQTKTKSSRKFVIMEPTWIDVVKKYLTKRPSPDMARLFIGFRGGKPTRQNMGHNTISKTPYKIAQYLQLPNVDEFTGHTLRRTSATILADMGGDILSLKRHGGWKSSMVAEGYVEESLTDKRRIANIIQGTPHHINLPAPSSSNILCERSEEVCSEMPSTSTHAATNSEITIPVENFTSNRNTSGINMTCHNCTINYYFK
ncbi:hypothetical protein Zmor_014987 [Zophobas morio]|uniref:Tyr recombinase domain-containing protein n=2 Tax=Zophobas morio TaxID=2755281 RepID=A0AA38IIG7_9CUCU|nr:hypothetical protein Zmor_014987 [Zophobas morio]